MGKTGNMKEIRAVNLVLLCVLFAAFALLGLTACQQTPAEPGQIRVFENGNANIKLLPDGNFIANLSHNIKITGTYAEKTNNDETAVLFTYNGINGFDNGTALFEAPGPVTAVGGIAGNVLTIPDDWDDGHGMKFIYREYPLVFAGENGQKITMYADDTFVAELAGDVTIIGFYGIRATSVTFVPGSPTFNGSGVFSGAALLAQLITDDDDDDHGHDHDDDDHDDHDDDDHDDDEEEDEEKKSLILEIPELWAKISGGREFTLQ